MTKKITTFFLLILLLTSVTAFSHTAEFENTGTNQYKKIRLFSDIYQNASLDSLRLKDENGKNIPYFIYSKEAAVESENASYPLSLIDSYTKDDLFYFDYKLSEEQKGDVISTGLSFTSPNNNFAKLVTIYGSHDNMNWDFVTGNMIYKIEGNSMLDINFTEETKYTHFRLELQNNLEKISFDTAKLIYNKTLFTEQYFTNLFTPQFEIVDSEKEGETHIKISGSSKLKLKSIDIISDSIFKREVRVGGISKEIYNLNFDGQKYMDRTVDLGGYIEEDEFLTAVIVDNDDEPIDIKSISVSYYVDDLVFEAKGNVTLEFGKETEKPKYDIEKSKDEIIKQKVDEMKFLSINIESEAEEPIPVEKDYTIWINITIVAVAILLAVVFLLRLRKPK